MSRVGIAQAPAGDAECPVLRGVNMIGAGACRVAAVGVITTTLHALERD
jgi:hypothetical protein